MTLTLESVTSKLDDVVAFVDIEESVHDRLVTADSLATVRHVRQQLVNSFSTFTYAFQYFSSKLWDSLLWLVCVLFR